MYSENDLKQLAAGYNSINAPQEVKDMAKKILDSEKSTNKAPKLLRFTKPLVAACVALVLIGGLNVSPAFASVMGNIPVVGKVFQLLTFRAYEDIDDSHSLVIDGAEIDGLGNTELAESLNEKYAAQSKELYNQFMEKLDSGLDNIALSSTYSVKADNGVTMSIEHSVFESAASGMERLEYDTIDVEKEIYITLPSLFADGSYIDVISGEIVKQMESRMAEDENAIYFRDEFDKIDAEQEFYIDDDHKLVITFDEYAIAPGYMGTVEFTIPTEVLDGILAGSGYIR